MNAKSKELEERLKLMLVISREEAAPRTIKELANLVFDGGGTALQLREKQLPDRDFYETATFCREFCHDRDKLFIINDRLDLAMAVDADCLHLGQKDLPAFVAARLWPRHKYLGVSVNTLDQAKAAIEAGADYLGVGAVFPTESKDDAILLSIETIKDIMALGIPTVAIGGITVENAADAWNTGFTGLAVISALAYAEDPKAVAKQLLNAEKK